MEQEKDKTSPEKDGVEIKLKEVEIDLKKQQLASMSPLDYLFAAAKLSIIDNTRTVLSDPVYKSIWDDEEIDEFKHLIMEKVRLL
mgnify:CR=1 FL=1